MKATSVCRFVLAAALLLALPIVVRPAVAAEGEMRWGLHVTLAAKWLDPAETEAFNTPFMVLYAVHDALVKPMPAGLSTPSLAESWTESKDHLAYTFALRKNARFHNGEPVTAEEKSQHDFLDNELRSRLASGPLRWHQRGPFRGLDELVVVPAAA